MILQVYLLCRALGWSFGGCVFYSDLKETAFNLPLV